MYEGFVRMHLNNMHVSEIWDAKKYMRKLQKEILGTSSSVAAPKGRDTFEKMKHTTLVKLLTL